jgi:DNA-binding response OmpR family regulator
MTDVSQWDGDALAVGAAVPVARTVMLVVEDDLVRSLMASGLRSAGCFPLPVRSSEQARQLATQVVPDAIVFDLDTQPGADIGWVHEVRKTAVDKEVRTVMLSAHLNERCGDGGQLCAAHLCLSKPVEPRHFVQSVLRLLRRPGGGAATGSRPPRAKAKLSAQGIEVDRLSATVRLQIDGQWRSVDLSPTEHRLLLALVDALPRVVSRQDLRDAVWPHEVVALRSVDQYVRRLRTALAEVGAQGLVRTVTGSGYRLQPPGG